MTTYTQQVAEFCSGLDLDDVPEDVLAHLTNTFVDIVGCGLYGSTLPWSRTLLSAVRGFAGSGSAAVIGVEHRLSPDLAALVNGAFIHSFEYDDLHMESFVHPGASVVPALLACVDHAERPVSGREFLAALVAGYEVEVRTGLCAGLSLLRRGWHNSAVVGPLGAGAAVARVLGLSPELTNQCLGASATQAGGLVSAQFGAMIKRLHPGRTAQSGFYAGMLVQAGYTGIQDVFDQEYGGYPATLTDDYDLDELTTALGQEWRSAGVGSKIFPASASCYTTIEACLWARNEMGVTPEDVVAVRVHCSSATLEHVGWAYQPDTVTTAQMNLRYCGAVALLDGLVDPGRFTIDRVAEDPAVRLAGRFEAVADPEIDAGGRDRRHAIRIELELADGRVVTTRIERAQGFGGRPVTASEIREKFLRITAEVLGEERKAVLDLLESVADLDDMRVLTAALATTQSTTPGTTHGHREQGLNR